MCFKCPRVNVNENINRLNSVAKKCFTGLIPLVECTVFSKKAKITLYHTFLVRSTRQLTHVVLKKKKDKKRR